MELVSVAATPLALMKSKNEVKGEVKGLDSKTGLKVKDQEKFADVLESKVAKPLLTEKVEKPLSAESVEKPLKAESEKQQNKPELPSDPMPGKFKTAPVTLKSEKKLEAKSDPPEEDQANEDSEDVSPPPELASRFQLGPKAEKPKTEREQAILKFMDSFESEFRIPPHEMVAAMAKLSHGQLAHSPEATADAVIEQLGLDDDQAGAAKQAYVGLLMQLHQIEQKNPTSPTTPLSNQALLQPQVKQRFEMGHDRKIQRDMSLQSLSNKFWMKNPEAATTMKGQIPVPAKSGLDMEAMSMQGDPDAFDGEAMLDGRLSQNAALNPQAHALMAAQAMPLQELDASQSQELKNFIEEHPDIKISPDDMKRLAQQIAHQKAVASSANAKGEPVMLQQGMMVKTEQATQRPEFMVGREPHQSSRDLLQRENQSGQSEQGFQNAMKHADGKALGGKGQNSKVNVEDLNFRQIAAGMNPEAAPSLKSGELAKLATPAVGTGQQAPAEANVRQLMNQAQYLIKNGGGEMKVQMTPEGLGTVQLKVSVTNGKVNVQMMTDSKEAKNVIESSIADLKTSLSAQKLSVEHVKVGVVNGVNTDNQSQSSNGSLNSNAQRDSTKQFWNQFQDSFGNQGRRDTLFDIDTNGYSPKRGRDPLQPVEGPSVARLKDGKGSGLNLVA